MSADTTAFDFFSTSLHGARLVPTKHSIRVVILDGAPWFVAADVCRALGFKHVETSMSRYVARLGDDERRKLDKTHGLATRFPTWAVSESGLYKLIMRSDAPAAGPFQEWVTREVLPAIRRTGGYRLAGVAPEAVEEGTVSEMPDVGGIMAQLQSIQLRADSIYAEISGIIPHKGISFKRDDLCHIYCGKQKSRQVCFMFLFRA